MKRCVHGLDPDTCIACFEWERDDSGDCNCCQCGAPIREDWSRRDVTCTECGHSAKHEGELCQDCQATEVCPRCYGVNGHKHWCVYAGLSQVAR